MIHSPLRDAPGRVFPCAERDGGSAERAPKASPSRGKLSPRQKTRAPYRGCAYAHQLHIRFRLLPFRNKQACLFRWRKIDFRRRARGALRRRADLRKSIRRDEGAHTRLAQSDDTPSSDLAHARPPSPGRGGRHATLRCRGDRKREGQAPPLRSNTESNRMIGFGKEDRGRGCEAVPLAALQIGASLF